MYEAIDYAARFTHALGEAKLDMDSLADGVQRYSRFGISSISSTASSPTMYVCQDRRR